MKTLEEYIQVLKRKGLCFAFHEGWKAICPLWWTTSQPAKELIHQERTFRYLQKRYAASIQAVEMPAQTRIPKIIWICWLQGIDHAPELVRQCFATVQHWASDYEIRVLTEENLFSYLSLPDAIMSKYQKGRIPFAQFSDIVRVSLLAQYGGIWLDATVALTGPLPRYITDEPLFFFRSSWLNPSPHIGSNWLLASTAKHPIMVNMAHLLVMYWQKEHYLRDYYIFHLLLAIVVKNSQQAAEMVARMPYVDNTAVHTMMFRGAKESYSQALKDDILSRSTIHKLSYKNGIDYSLYIQS